MASVFLHSLDASSCLQDLALTSCHDFPHWGLWPGSCKQKFPFKPFLFLLFFIALNLDIRVCHTQQLPVKLMEMLRAACRVPVTHVLYDCIYRSYQNRYHFFPYSYPSCFFSKCCNLLRDFGLITRFIIGYSLLPSYWTSFSSDYPQKSALSPCRFPPQLPPMPLLPELRFEPVR